MRIGSGIVVTALVGFCVVGLQSGTPAMATDVCVVTGTAIFDSPVWYPAAIPLGMGADPYPWSNGGSFDVSGACSGGDSSPSAFFEFPNGAQCGRSTNGYGTFDGTGAEFALEEIGTVLILSSTDTSNPVLGVMDMTPLVGTSCRADLGGTRTFTLAGVLVLGSVGTPEVPPQCRDGLDNDLDGRTDYSDDPDCADPDDPAEASSSPPPSCPSVGGVPVCATVSPGAVFQTVAASFVQTPVASTHHVAGTVDIYRFTVPTGGTVTVPCVVLTADAADANPCQVAGASFVSRIATLLDRTADQPSAVPGGALATVKVCHAIVTLTVAGIGIEAFPAYALC